MSKNYNTVHMDLSKQDKDQLAVIVAPFIEKHLKTNASILRHFGKKGEKFDAYRQEAEKHFNMSCQPLFELYNNNLQVKAVRIFEDNGLTKPLWWLTAALSRGYQVIAQEFEKNPLQYICLAKMYIDTKIEKHPEDPRYIARKKLIDGLINEILEVKAA